MNSLKPKSSTKQDEGYDDDDVQVLDDDKEAVVDGEEPMEGLVVVEAPPIEVGASVGLVVVEAPSAGVAGGRGVNPCYLHPAGRSGSLSEGLV